MSFRGASASGRARRGPRNPAALGPGWLVPVVAASLVPIGVAAALLGFFDERRPSAPVAPPATLGELPAPPGHAPGLLAAVGPELLGAALVGLPADQPENLAPPPALESRRDPEAEPTPAGAVLGAAVVTASIEPTAAPPLPTATRRPTPPPEPVGSSPEIANVEVDAPAMERTVTVDPRALPPPAEPIDPPDEPAPPALALAQRLPLATLPVDPPTRPPSMPIIVGEASCANGEATFTIQNHGGPMSSPWTYTLYQERTEIRSTTFHQGSGGMRIITARGYFGTLSLKATPPDGVEQPLAQTFCAPPGR